ncbi:MAG: YIP1 family protein [Thermoanaerobaculia bacterium]
MSTLPPPFDPPPPPPPPGAALPWEERDRLGWVAAFVATVQMMVTAPAEAWQRTRVKNDLLEPLLFSVIVTWIGMVFSSIYGALFSRSWMTMLPADLQEKLAPAMVAGSPLIKIVLAPVLVAVGLFIGAGIVHLCLMIVGGLSSSSAGFEGTFRVVAYSGVADLANVIPIAGPLIAFVWKLILLVMGIQVLHRTSSGKAIAAVLLPVLLCCGCVVVAFGAILAAVFGALKH